MGAFIEILAALHDPTLARRDAWVDFSTAEYFVFKSTFASITLRKRVSYPRTFVQIDDSRLQMGYGRQIVGQSVAAESLLDVPEEVFYDEEFLYISIDCQAQQIVMQRDALCSVPLFFGNFGQRLHIANQFALVLSTAPSDSLTDKVALAEILLGRDSFNRTIAQDVTLIYDRRQVQWSAAGMMIEVPPDGIIRRIASEPTGDPLQFGHLLEDTVISYWDRYVAGSRAGCTLSYGVDSSLIAAILTDKGRQLDCVTAVYPGAFGESILRKSQDFSVRFKLNSYLYRLDVDTDYPLSHLAKVGWQPMYHGADMYAAAYDHFAQYLSERGVTSVFLGVGGDELCENTPHADQRKYEGTSLEPDSTLPAYFTQKFLDDSSDLFRNLRETPPPTPLLSYSVAGYAPAMNNSFLACNIWPVQPLCDPRLYTYCQSLPHHYRYNKAILTAYGRARHIPPSILDTKNNEDFSPFFNESVARNLSQPLSRFMDASVLARSGYIDRIKALEAFETARHDLAQKGIASGDNTFYTLYQLLVTEVTLQTGKLRIV